MYARYAYKATATQAQVLRDLVKILTGTTDLAQLSASCDTANTSIDTAFCGTGNNFDVDPAAATATTQAFRMSVHDDPSTYIYATLALTTVTKLYLRLGITAGWNSSTHAAIAPSHMGTNLVDVTGLGTTAGAIFLWSDGKAVVVGASAVASTGLAAGVAAIFQFTREDAWRTTANGCHPVCALGGGAWAVSGNGAYASSAPACLKQAVSGAFTSVGSNNSNCCVLPDVPNGTDTSFGSGMSTTYSPAYTYSADLTAIPTLWGIRAGGLPMYQGGGPLGGSVSEISPIYFLGHPTSPNPDDLVQYQGESYRVLSGKLVCRVG